MHAQMGNRGGCQADKEPLLSGSESYQLGTMSCIRSGHDDYPSPETLMHSDHQPGFNGLTSTSVGEAVPPDPPPPERAPLKPALSHIDFWPSCQTRALRACEATFEAFERLVERANRWMAQFPDYELINCETADKKVKLVQDIYSASMCFRDEDLAEPTAIHIKGLRLWYRQRRTKSSSPSVIHYVDFTPRYLNPGDKHPRFDTMPEILETANHRLKEFPIQGSILSIATVMFKVPEEEFCGEYRVDPERCFCFDEYFTHQISFLRVFYKLGQPAYEVIGVKDFPPEPIDEGGIFHPAHYSPFSSLVEKAAAWINQSRGIRVTNLNTLECKHRKKSENQGHRFNTDRLFEFKIEGRFRAYFLRVGYIRPSDPSMCLASYPPPDIACRTFVPQLKRGVQYENFTEVLDRAEACVNYTCANPFHVEFVPLPEWMIKREFCERGDRTFFDGEWYFESDKDGNQKGPYRHPIIYAIRVYFDGDFEDPPFMIDEGFQGPDESCCKVM